MIATLDFPTRIRIGDGALGVLTEELQDLGLESALVVTDPGIRDAGLVDRLLAVLAGAAVGATVFDGVQTNPTETDVLAGLEAWRESGADHLIALGGGAAIDTAKAIRLLATHEGPLARFVGEGRRHVTADLPPMVAIPTTAGTGSEVGRSFVVSLSGRPEKVVVGSPHLMPSLALCDAGLTRELPPQVTAATGMDALTHNVEAYLAQGFHPLADAIAIRGMAIAARYLPRAVRDGKGDPEARSGMMTAALMGAVAFQKGLGLCHALAHALGAHLGIHHGLANALMLPAVLRFNAEAAGARVDDVATALGASGAGYGGEAGERAAARVEDLRARAGLPATLSEAGVSAEKVEAVLDALVAHAQADGCLPENPREAGPDDLRALFRSAI
jgi:4-hydroxybutyrate dehydrogenase